MINESERRVKANLWKSPQVIAIAINAVVVALDEPRYISHCSNLIFEFDDWFLLFIGCIVTRAQRILLSLWGLIYISLEPTAHLLHIEWGVQFLIKLKDFATCKVSYYSYVWVSVCKFKMCRFRLSFCILFLFSFFMFGAGIICTK